MSSIKAILKRGVWAGALTVFAAVNYQNQKGAEKMSTMAELRDQAEKVAEKVYGYYKDTSGWTVAKTAKEVTVSYKSSSEFDGHLYKAEAIFNSPPERILKFLLPVPRGLRGKWDKSVKLSEVIETDGEDFVVVHSGTRSAAMGLIAPRDFCDVLLVKHCPEEGAIAVGSQSAEHPSCPPLKGYTRGYNYANGTVFVDVPGEPNKCKVINFIQTDLKGMLPRALVESALPSNMVELFCSLEQALKTMED